MATKAAIMRLRKEFVRLQQDAVEGFEACPLESDILEWHYIVTGPPNTPYAGGKYHGKLIFPPSYPFKPPSIMMCTPSGRFKTNTRLCLSMSDFHPETWNPIWSVSTILKGLVSFMAEDEETTGSMKADDDTRRKLAAESWGANMTDKTCMTLFPHYRNGVDERPKRTSTAPSTPTPATATATATPTAAVAAAASVLETKAPATAASTIPSSILSSSTSTNNVSSTSSTSTLTVSSDIGMADTKAKLAAEKKRAKKKAQKAKLKLRPTSSSTSTIDDNDNDDTRDDDD